eukprot:Blabericola_migrator_1__12643@NODE_806_length_6438_cov_127_513734_g571_i0_p9_GENE_NODE_806_length_6438_cov_127_513734_g571_i0NODE_806_length_6438_cov_127_513734_g571_i0_p9_ORF_typecomplete_len130_score23_76_NODE_806_length_6438_cov_127_513734_g571_i056766065
MVTRNYLLRSRRSNGEDSTNDERREEEVSTTNASNGRCSSWEDVESSDGEPEAGIESVWSLWKEALYTLIPRRLPGSVIHLWWAAPAENFYLSLYTQVFKTVCVDVSLARNSLNALFLNPEPPIGQPQL